MSTEPKLDLQQCSEEEMVQAIRATLALLTMQCGAAYKRFRIEVAYTMKPVDGAVKLMDERITKVL